MKRGGVSHLYKHGDKTSPRVLNERWRRTREDGRVDIYQNIRSRILEKGFVRICEGIYLVLY